MFFSRVFKRLKYTTVPLNGHRSVKLIRLKCSDICPNYRIPAKEIILVFE